MAYPTDKRHERGHRHRVTKRFYENVNRVGTRNRRKMNAKHEVIKQFRFACEDYAEAEAILDHFVANANQSFSLTDYPDGNSNTETVYYESDIVEMECASFNWYLLDFAIIAVRDD